MPETTSKPWWKSMTLWGSALTILSVISPRVATVVSPALSEAGVIVGAITSIIGRIRNPGGGVPQRPTLQ